MSNRQNHFNQIINKLEAHYGASKPPSITDLFHLLLYENIAYLADDTKRDTAFAALKKEVGLKPTDILSASTERLVTITKLGGIHAELRAARLKEVAHIVLNEFQGDLESVLRLPLPKAIKALRQFPSIGEPGAEKVLLFTGTYPVLALESNGLKCC
jgi:endonuclease-3